MKYKVVTILLVVAAFVAVAIIAMSRQSVAPDVSYVSVMGEQTSQSKLRGQVVLINFWATSCTACVAEMPKLVATHNKYQSKGFETIAVAMSYDPPAFVSNFTKQHQLPFFVALDVDGSLAKRFGDVSVTPTTLLIDKKGQIVKRFLGEPDFPALHALIEQKLAEPA